MWCCMYLLFSGVLFMLQIKHRNPNPLRTHAFIILCHPDQYNMQLGLLSKYIIVPQWVSLGLQT